jgi:hypothetical protein
MVYIGEEPLMCLRIMDQLIRQVVMRAQESNGRPSESRLSHFTLPKTAPEINAGHQAQRLENQIVISFKWFINGHSQEINPWKDLAFNSLHLQLKIKELGVTVGELSFPSPSGLQTN